MKRAEVATQTDVNVAQEDVDDIVEIAMHMMIEDDDKLSLEEVEAIGEELDIPAEYIAKAQKQLERDRKAALKAEREAEMAADAKKRIVTLILAAIGMLGAGWVTIVVTSISGAYARVEAAERKVENVIERKAEIEKLYDGKPESADKQAELVGAQNRIRVETGRKADAVAEYGNVARGPVSSMIRAAMGLPAPEDIK